VTGNLGRQASLYPPHLSQFKWEAKAESHSREPARPVPTQVEAEPSIAVATLLAPMMIAPIT
jgi:hypothetical protein